MIKLKVKEKIYYGKNGKPASVILDYKDYQEMLELIEDMQAVKLIEKRKKEKTIKEKDFLAKYNIK
ncbi:MAG: type II toxin-antitoxin system Phd/YefM family antitoxin [Ignavibacteriaceae bacterium]|nr:type II toxin-antitoxin system Phd/YefM family antitoxin [Ignavibacteriaceae bacterium]